MLKLLISKLKKLYVIFVKCTTQTQSIFTIYYNLKHYCEKNKNNNNAISCKICVCYFFNNYYFNHI